MSTKAAFRLRASASFLVLLALAGCLQEVGPKEGSYYALEVRGFARQAPAYEGAEALCGAPAGRWAGFDVERRRFAVVKGWNDVSTRTEVIVFQDLRIDDDGNGCHWAEVYAERSSFHWTWEGQGWTVRPDAEGLWFDDHLLTPEEPWTVPVDGPSLHPDWPSTRNVGHVTFIVHGPWRIADVVEVPDRGGDVGQPNGLWIGGRPMVRSSA